GQKPWGLREYTVRDLNGYHLRFGEPVVNHASGSRPKPLPEGIRLVERLPTVEEYVALVRAVDWERYTNMDAVPAALRNTLYSVVAEDGRRAVGMARLVGDGAMAFYVQDVMVIPSHQQKGIGSALMNAVTDHFRRA